MLMRDLKKIFIDTKTKQRITQHIINQNDVITDEDISNINTNLEELKISKLTIDMKTSIARYPSAL
jgi:ABC-type phosphate transport system auxiliary subunit